MGRDAFEASEAALVLVAALGAHDRRTRGHSERVRTLADLLAKEAGLSDEERDKLRWGALLHDIGKLAVPGAILNKPDRPNEEEWATLQRHPEEGEHLVEPLVTWLGPWAGAVGHHHEKWDGSGYPHGLAGEDISLGGRILAIADAYEVMTATRAYKVPMSAAAAREELVASSGTHFDPALVRAFMGISLGALWWTTGVAALLAQIPLLGRVGAAPGLARIRSGLSGGATAVATVPPWWWSARSAAGAAPGSRPSPGSRPHSPPRPAAAPAPAPAPVTAARRRRRPSRCRRRRPRRRPAGPSGPATTGRPRPSTRLLEGVATTVTTAPPAGQPVAVRAVRPAGLAAPPPPAPAPKPFTAKGQLLAPDLLGRLGIGLTNRGPAGGCGPSAGPGPRRLGVRTARPTAPAAGAPVKATGSDLLGLHNLAVTFVSERLPGAGAAGHECGG